MLLKATILCVSATVMLGHLFNPLRNFNLQIGLRRSLRDAWRNVLTAGVKRLIRPLKTLLGLSFSIKGLKGKGTTEKASRVEDYVKQKLLLYCHLLVICLYIVVSLTRHGHTERARGRHENRAALGEATQGSVGADYSHRLKRDQKQGDIIISYLEDPFSLAPVYSGPHALISPSFCPSLAHVCS